MHVSARITRTEYDALVDMAEKDDRTESYLVAKAIREFLERHAGKPAPRRSK